MHTQDSFLRKGGISYVAPFILVTSLFFFWGLANNMTDTLLAAFKQIMRMNSLQTSFIQMAFYGSYFCFAFPAALFIRKYSYKAGIILGVALFTTGGLLFYPAGLASSFAFYLIAIYILAGGCSILETTANPFVLSMGSNETATRRLNLAQAFNPIGSISGILISQAFILSAIATDDARAMMSQSELAVNQSKELLAVSLPYMVVGVILLSILVALSFIKLPKHGDEKGEPVRDVLKKLFHNKRYLYGVVAQFFYVGAQIGTWSYMIQYVSQEMHWEPKSAADIFIYSIGCFIVARFFFTFLMKYIFPAKLLLFAGIMAIISTLIVIFGHGYVALSAMVAISFFMSLMFPTIYGIALKDLGPQAKIGASGLIMAILGGALLTTLQGWIASSNTKMVGDTLIEDFSLSYIVPASCFVVVVLYAIYIIRNREPECQES